MNVFSKMHFNLANDESLTVDYVDGLLDLLTDCIVDCRLTT